MQESEKWEWEQNGCGGGERNVKRQNETRESER